METLEDRTVPTVTLGTALSVGHELGSSTALDVAADAAGNSYMVGSFSGTTDFDPSHTLPGNADILTARGTQDGYIAKYAPDNSLLWVRRMGGDNTVVDHNLDSTTDVAVDASGNVYIAGNFFGSADFGATTLVSSDPASDGFVAKLSPNGTFQWAIRWGQAGTDTTLGLAVDSSGYVYTLERIWYGGSTENATLNIFKFRSNGAVVWTDSIVTGGIFGGDMALDTSGNVYVGADFHTVTDFDPGPKTYYVSAAVSNFFESGFVLKLTTAGKFAWVSPFVGRTIGSDSGYSYVQSIALDGSGNVLAGGGYSGPVDFNPGSGTTVLPTGGRAFITKLNSSGGLIWANALESDNFINMAGLAVDTAGSIYATGAFNGTVDFDPGAGTSSKTTAGGNDIFVMKLNSSGNFSWAETFGSTGSDSGSGIAVDPSGTIHLAGSYRGSVDFDPDPLNSYWLTNPGDFSNAFLVLLRQS
jgi:hypothetical protein